MTRLPNVLRRNFDSARQEISEFAELPYSFGQTGAKPIDVGASLSGWNQIDVAFGNRLLGRLCPNDRPFNSLRAAFESSHEGVFRKTFGGSNSINQVLGESVFEQPGFFLSSGFLTEGNAESWAKDRFGAKECLEASHSNSRAVKIVGFGPETDLSPRVLLGRGADFTELADFFATGETDIPDFSLPSNFNIQSVG